MSAAAHSILHLIAAQVQLHTEICVTRNKRITQTEVSRWNFPKNQIVKSPMNTPKLKMPRTLINWKFWRTRVCGGSLVCIFDATGNTSEPSIEKAALFYWKKSESGLKVSWPVQAFRGCHICWNEQTKTYRSQERTCIGSTVQLDQ